MGKNCARGLEYGPRPKAEGRTQDQGHSLFPIRTDLSREITYLFFSGRLLFKVENEIGIKDVAYVASRALKKHQIKNTKENNVSIFQRLALF